MLKKGEIFYILKLMWEVEKMQKKTKLCFAFLIGMAFLLWGMITQASYGVSIDSTKYPGYQEALQELQQRHPNWSFEFLYTGLNWTDVVTAENTGHNTKSPTSLVYDTYAGEWICPICGDKKYDLSGRWYCASQKAIAYMMDPRNAFSDQYIFQFQDLSSSTGTRDEIKKMVTGTFLDKDSYIDAIMTAATTNNVSPFHITSRILQEQGAGTGPYVTGYIYLDKMVYNAFNIGANGGIGEYESGAKRAYEEGWFTFEDSIIGGTKFIKEKYIDVGQVNLYFQKYDVIEEGGLYNHQYMQNIEAARSEGNIMYQSYVENGLVDSHFTFLIPVYENMPAEASPRPSNTNKAYSGDIANEITSLELAANENNEHYIKGEIIISEWINGTQWSIPKDTPKMRIESLQGETVAECWVNPLHDNTYYFDVYVETLDPLQDYKIIVESGSSNNVSIFREQQGNYNQNKELGTFRRDVFMIENNILIFTPTNYYGDMATQLNELALEQSEKGYYLKGNVIVTEWIGTTWTIPDVTPIINLKSVDGEITYSFWVRPLEGNQYYFDGYINDINLEKEYVFEVVCNNPYNISNNKIVNAYSPSEISLGLYEEEAKVYFRDSKLVFDIQTYIGDIATNLNSLTLAQNEKGETYLKGEVVVTEWLDGVTWSIPKKTPKITIKTTDGQIVYTCWVNPLGGNTYYFDTYIEGIDINKTYVIEVMSGSIGNISSYRTTNIVKSGGILLGNYKGEPVIFKEGKITIGEPDYIGDIATNLNSLTLAQNEKGETYLKGEVVVTEWLDGVTWSIPKKTPKITIKTTDGQIAYTCWVNPLGGNTYYFDTYIEGIDTSKTYVIEVESGDSHNISSYRKANIVNNGEIVLGNYLGEQVLFKNGKMSIEGLDYIGDVATNLNSLILAQNEKGESYIKGEIVVTEWLDGITWSIPKKTPKITLKSTDGAVIYTCWVNPLGGNTYYFDTYIEGIDTNKNYMLEVASGSSHNISTYNKVQVNAGKTMELGTYKDTLLTVEGSVWHFITTQKNKEIEPMIEQIPLLEEKEIEETESNIEVEEPTIEENVVREDNSQEKQELEDNQEETMEVNETEKENNRLENRKNNRVEN